MAQRLTCPQCQTDRVLRSYPQSLREHVASWLGIAPFHCQDCRFRFLTFRLSFNEAKPPADRREHFRIPVRLFLSFSGGKIRGEGTVLDLSMGGCVIQSETQVHIDDIFYLQVAISDQDPPLEVAAMVRSVGPRGIAFKFLRKAQDDKRLQSFIHAHSSPLSSREMTHSLAR
ncbi:MAG: PilZ domain-containing protein [Nitrospira sp.]|jgi:hypothetical protein|nr:PilZ domain-containing protein [Nitrospira sp.]